MPHQMCGMACHFSCRNSAGWWNIHVSGIKHRYDAVISRHESDRGVPPSVSEGGLWCNIYLSGVRHRYDAVISRHNVVVVRHTEGVALSPLHKGRCPTGQRGKHQDFVLLCYATSMTCRATFPVGKVQYAESTEFSCRKSAGWRRVLPKKCRKF